MNAEDWNELDVTRDAIIRDGYEPTLEALMVFAPRHLLHKIKQELNILDRKDRDPFACDFLTPFETWCALNIKDFASKAVTPEIFEAGL